MSIKLEESPRTSASLRRRMAQEALRVQIDGDKQLAALEAIRTEALTAEKDQAPLLKLRADISLNLLRKVLPDLKHVEVSGDEESPLTVALVRYSPKT